MATRRTKHSIELAQINLVKNLNMMYNKSPWNSNIPRALLWSWEAGLNCRPRHYQLVLGREVNANQYHPILFSSLESLALQGLSCFLVLPSVNQC